MTAYIVSMVMLALAIHIGMSVITGSLLDWPYGVKAPWRGILALAWPVGMAFIVWLELKQHFVVDEKE